MRQIFSVMLLIGALAGANVVSADEVMVNFLAEVEYVDDMYCQCLPPAAILPGDTLRGSFVYDRSVTDLEPDPYEGIYLHYSSPSGVVVYHDDFFFGTDPGAVDFRVFTYDSVMAGDELKFSSYGNTPDPFYSGGMSLLLLQFWDETATAFDSDSLPQWTFTLSDWSSATLDIYGGSYGYLIHSNVLWVGTGQPPTGVVHTPPQVGLLRQNMPNPFNPTTTIEYAVASSGPVTLIVYDAQGTKVRTLVNSFREPGRQYVATWDGMDDDGRGVASGVYFYRLTTPVGSRSKKLVFLK